MDKSPIKHKVFDFQYLYWIEHNASINSRDIINKVNDKIWWTLYVAFNKLSMIIGSKLKQLREKQRYGMHS